MTTHAYALCCWVLQPKRDIDREKGRERESESERERERGREKEGERERVGSSVFSIETLNYKTIYERCISPDNHQKKENHT